MADLAGAGTMNTKKPRKQSREEEEAEEEVQKHEMLPTRIEPERSAISLRKNPKMAMWTISPEEAE